MTPPVSLLWGEGRNATYARYWLADAVASDDGLPFSFTAESNDVAPVGLGGEALFTMAFLTVRAAAGCVLRVTPIINDEDVLTRAHPGGTLAIIRPLVTVPQQSGGPPTPMLTQTFEIPLWQELAVGGAVKGLWHLRGERCRLRLESIGTIGTGAFRVEQCELEYEPIRRATFAATSR